MHRVGNIPRSPGSDITDNSYTFSPTDLLRFYVDDQIIEGELFVM